jgi:regulator of replication initiation timing
VNCELNRWISVENVESYPQNVDNYPKSVDNFKKTLDTIYMEGMYVCNNIMFFDEE